MNLAFINNLAILVGVSSGFRKFFKKKGAEAPYNFKKLVENYSAE
jgi:hypothetical protein